MALRPVWKVTPLTNTIRPAQERMKPALLHASTNVPSATTSASATKPFSANLRRTRLPPATKRLPHRTELDEHRPSMIRQRHLANCPRPRRERRARIRPHLRHALIHRVHPSAGLTLRKEMWQKRRMSRVPLPPPSRARSCTPKLRPGTGAGFPSEVAAKSRIMDWSALETKLIRIGNSSTGCQQEFGDCKEQHIRAWLICEGNLESQFVGDTARHPAARWLIATPGCEESALTRNAESLLVTFDATWPSGESLFRETASRSFSAESYPEMEAAALALLCFVRNNLPDGGSTPPNSVADIHVYVGLRRRVDAWLEAFVAAMTAEGAVPTRLGIADQRIQRALRLLDSWSLEVPLDRERVAREAGITVPHLTRIFNAQLRHTPSRYFDSRRIAHARRSLSELGITIKAIASELGFHSEAHFSHWFKQHEGACPRSFRQAHLGTAWAGS